MDPEREGILRSEFPKSLTPRFRNYHPRHAVLRLGGRAGTEEHGVIEEMVDAYASEALIGFEKRLNQDVLELTVPRRMHGDLKREFARKMTDLNACTEDRWLTYLRSNKGEDTQLQGFAAKLIDPRLRL